MSDTTEKTNPEQKNTDVPQKLSFKETLEKNSSLRIKTLIFSLILYIIFYLLIFYTAGRNMSVSALIPAITVGWVFGLFPGIIAGFICLPLNIIMRIIVVNELWGKGFTPGTAAVGTGAVILSAAFVGKIRDLETYFRKNLHERKLAEKKLIEHCDRLDRQASELHEINKDLEKASIERKKTVEKLNETKNRLESLIELSLDPITICDPKGYIVKPNRAFCEMIKSSEEALIGKSINSFIPTSPGKYISETGEEIHLSEEFLHKGAEIIGLLFSEGRVSDWKAYILDKNNKIIPTLNSAVCLYNEKDELTGTFFVVKDRSEQRRTEQAMTTSKEEAEAANRSKNLFLANMSHEIRTPMNGVIGFTDILLNSNLNTEQEDYVRTIKRSGEALLSLLNDILDFSKIESGKIDVEEIDFDVEVLAHDVCELIRPRISEKGVELLFRIGDDVPSQIKGDPYRFRQVLVNLMGNAAKFTEKGEIELSVDVEEKKEDRLKLHITIRDTGIGIPKDKVDSIFEIFQQADGSTTRKYGGTGLGLSICRKIASIMGGNVWAESKPDKGSVFHFTTRVKETAVKHKKRYETGSLKNRKVLVYDSNRSSLAILTDSLKAGGMKVTDIARIENIINTIKSAAKSKEPYDLCILDISGATKENYVIARKIRSSVDSTMPLLAFSSSIDVSARICRDAGFNGFLPKPVNRIKLNKMMSRLLGQAEEKSKLEKDGPQAIVTQYSIREDIKHSISILLAEDNLINQKLAEKILTKAGYGVDVANNGEEAVNLFLTNQDKYDIIFMDIQMPRLNGHDATIMLRKKGFTDIPIVAITANVMKDDREKCLKSGMNDYIPKPVKREVVFEMLQKWVIEKNSNV